MSKINVGDTVIHIVLHRIMTVGKISDSVAECDWFEGEEHKRATFIVEELTLCPESQRPTAIDALSAKEIVECLTQTRGWVVESFNADSNSK